MRILFFPCYVHWKHVVFFFVGQPAWCIRVILTVFLLYSGCSNCILGNSYMYDFTRRQCKIRWMELECARDCCKVDIRVNSALSYTGHDDSYIILLFSYPILFILFHSCEILGRTEQFSSYFHTFIEKERCPTKKNMIWPFNEEEWSWISKFLHSATFGSTFLTVRLGHYTDTFPYDILLNMAKWFAEIESICSEVYQ